MTQSLGMPFLVDMSGLENMIQGGTREALAVEDLILRAAVVAVVAAVEGATAAVLAAAEAGAQRLNLRVGRLQNQHRDLPAPALSQGHHLQEDMDIRTINLNLGINIWIMDYLVGCTHVFLLRDG